MAARDPLHVTEPAVGVLRFALAIEGLTTERAFYQMLEALRLQHHGVVSDLAVPDVWRCFRIDRDEGVAWVEVRVDEPPGHPTRPLPGRDAHERNRSAIVALLYLAAVQGQEEETPTDLLDDALAADGDHQRARQEVRRALATLEPTVSPEHWLLVINLEAALMAASLTGMDVAWRLALAIGRALGPEEP